LCHENRVYVNPADPHPGGMELASPHDPHPALSRHPLPFPQARDILPSHRMGAERESFDSQNTGFMVTMRDIAVEAVYNGSGEGVWSWLFSAAAP
jgi:hypothetical protein